MSPPDKATMDAVNLMEREEAAMRKGAPSHRRSGARVLSKLGTLAAILIGVPIFIVMGLLDLGLWAACIYCAAMGLISIPALSPFGLIGYGAGAFILCVLASSMAAIMGDFLNP